MVEMKASCTLQWTKKTKTRTKKNNKQKQQTKD
jgi:hypothetical protein